MRLKRPPAQALYEGNIRQKEGQDRGYMWQKEILTITSGHQDLENYDQINGYGVIELSETIKRLKAEQLRAQGK